MQQPEHRPVSRLRKPQVLVLCLGVLLLGGAAFAATGGAQIIKNWFVRVEINGEPRDVPLDENGQATFTVETDDGEATVHIQKAESPQGEMTRVRVTTGDEAFGEEVEDEIVMGGMGSLEATTHTLADLGDAKPIHTWTDAEGATRSLYLIPAEQGARLFISTTRKPGEVEVKQIGQTNMPLDGTPPQVDVADDGTITLTLNDGMGREAVMKFLLSHNAGDLPRDLDTGVPGAKVRIQLDPAGEED